MNNQGRLRFLCCGGGIGAGRKVLGDNSATFQQNVNGENNLLIIDMGLRAYKILKRINLLKREGIDNVILHFTHLHGDHMHPKSLDKLKDILKKNKINFKLLLTDTKQDELNYTALCRAMHYRDIQTINTGHAAQKLGLQNIEGETIFHYKRPKIYKPNREELTSCGLIFTDHRHRDTAYLTDHHDPEAVTDALEHCDTVFTDCSDRYGESHMWVGDYTELIHDSDDKAKIRLMHMPKGVKKQAYKAGLKTAVPFLITSEKEYNPYGYGPVRALHQVYPLYPPKDKLTEKLGIDK